MVEKVARRIAAGAGHDAIMSDPGASDAVRNFTTRFLPRETRRGALPGGLRRPADRPPADGDPGADDQGRRLGAGALRRRLLQAAELDVPAVHRPRGHHRRRPGRVDGHLEDRRHPAHPHRGDPPRLLPRPRRRPRAAEGRRREAPAGAAGRAPRHAGRRADPGPPRVPHRHRPGRPDVPRRRRRQCRGRDQAPRRDRRGRAADPLPRAAQPRPAAGSRCAASSRPRRSSPRRGCSPPTAASPARSWTTTRCGAWTTPSTGCSDADLPHRHRRRLGCRTGVRRVHDLHARPDPRGGGVHPRLAAGAGARGLRVLLQGLPRSAGPADDRDRPADRDVA